MLPERIDLGKKPAQRRGTDRSAISALGSVFGHQADAARERLETARVHADVERSGGGGFIVWEEGRNGFDFRVQ